MEWGPVLVCVLGMGSLAGALTVATTFMARRKELSGALQLKSVFCMACCDMRT